MPRPCARIAPHFNNEIMPEIKKSYIDTGKVLYVFRVYPIGAPDGVAEKLARCMPKAKYFPFMDQLFRTQPEWDPRIWRAGCARRACCSRPEPPA